MTDPAHTTTTPADVAFTTAYLDDLRRVIEGLDAHSIATAIEWMRQTRDADGTIFICGNGGSGGVVEERVAVGVGGWCGLCKSCGGARAVGVGWGTHSGGGR